MKKVFAWIFFCCLISASTFAATIPVSSSLPGPGTGISAEQIRAKIAGLKIKDVQKMAGRKLTLKEKVSFLLFKKKLKHKPKEESGSSQGKTALAFGISGLVLLIVGLFVPYVILGALVASIIAIVIGSTAYKKDPSDRKAYSGKLLGWITLGATALLFIIAAAVLASWA